VDSGCHVSVGADEWCSGAVGCRMVVMKPPRVAAFRLPLRGVGVVGVRTPGSRTHPGLSSRCPFGAKKMTAGSVRDVVNG
jgi:hypothetical protein